MRLNKLYGQLRWLPSCLITYARLWVMELEHQLASRSANWLVMRLLWMSIFSWIWLMPTLVSTIGHGGGNGEQYSDLGGWVVHYGMMRSLWSFLIMSTTLTILRYLYMSSTRWNVFLCAIYLLEMVSICHLLDGNCFYMSNISWNEFLYVKYLLDLICLC